MRMRLLMWIDIEGREGGRRVEVQSSCLCLFSPLGFTVLSHNARPACASVLSESFPGPVTDRSTVIVAC